MEGSATLTFAPGILVDRELASLLGGQVRARAGAPPIAPAQIQPASIDLRLGPIAHRIRAGFLPSPTSIEERLRELSISTLSLEGEGAVFERGHPYMVRLEEELALPSELRGRTNPRKNLLGALRAISLWNLSSRR
jgi:dCTP deaminase